MIGVRRLLHHHAKQQATSGTDQPLVDCPPFAGGQHLSRMADGSDDLALPDAAPPNSKRACALMRTGLAGMGSYLPDASTIRISSVLRYNR